MGWWGGVCIVIFMSNPTAVFRLRLCCVVVGVVSIGLNVILEIQPIFWMSILIARWGRLYLDKEDARERDALLLLAQTMNTIMVTHILVHFL